MKNNRLTKLQYAKDKESAFHQALMIEAQTYLDNRVDHRFANKTLLLKNIFMLLLCMVCYLLSLYQHTIWLFVAYYFGFVLFAMLANINGQHDACHNVLFRSRLANSIFGRIVTLPLGVDPHYWQTRHVDYHHIYPNIADYDLDLEENGIFRQSPFQKWYPHMRYQPYYWPIVASFSLPYIAWVFDWSDHLGKTPLVRDQQTLRGLKGWMLFLGSKLLHFILALFIPIIVLNAVGINWYTVLLVYLLSQMLASLIVVILFLGTHWSDPEFYTAPQDGKFSHGWYHQQLTTCCDWYPSPRILNELLGGVNLHLTHHLFPSWSHRHYPALQVIIERLAKQYQFPYRKISYRELFLQQQRFIRKMAEKPHTHNQ